MRRQQALKNLAIHFSTRLIPGFLRRWACWGIGLHAWLELGRLVWSLVRFLICSQTSHPISWSGRQYDFESGIIRKTRWVRLDTESFKSSLKSIRKKFKVPLYSSLGCLTWKWVASWRLDQQPACGKACCTCPWEYRGGQVKRKSLSAASSAIGATGYHPLLVHYNLEHDVN